MAESTGGSCEMCKKKKCKCDRQVPICGQCEASRSVCKYSESNKRGIPTGYLGLLEQRLNETEKVLYKTLSELAARDGLKAREWTPREAGMSKHERMKEWKEYPLNGEGCIERWRGLFGGSDVPDNVEKEVQQQMDLNIYGSSPHSSITQSLPYSGNTATAYRDREFNINIPLGYMGQPENNNSPRFQRSEQIQEERSQNYNVSPNPSPHSTQNQITEQQSQMYDSGFGVVGPTEDEGYHVSIDRVDPSSSGHWEHSPGTYHSGDGDGDGQQVQLNQAQQLSKAFRNTYY